MKQYLGESVVTDKVKPVLFSTLLTGIWCVSVNLVLW